MQYVILPLQHLSPRPLQFYEFLVELGCRRRMVRWVVTEEELREPGRRPEARGRFRVRVGLPRRRVDVPRERLEPLREHRHELLQEHEILVAGLRVGELLAAEHSEEEARIKRLERRNHRRTPPAQLLE